MSINRNLWIVTAINNRNGEQTVLAATSSRENARREARNTSRENYSYVRIGKARKIGRGIKVS